MTKALLKAALRKIGLQPVDRGKEPDLAVSTDRAFHELYELAKTKTRMTGFDPALRRERHYTLKHLLSNALIEEGDVCEVGCWRGLSAYQIAAQIRSSGTPATFHIFDSFAGLSEDQPADELGGSREALTARRQQLACPLETVQENLKEFPFIEYHPGWIPERFGDVEEGRFCFVHVDVVLHQPIRDSFLFFYPRLTRRGIMVFDDYGYGRFPGAKKAVDECRKLCGDPFFLPLPSGQAFLINHSPAESRR
ncbi:MAG: TylF/MycF/NovP-related O-methyltransferase [Candidatus Binatia bacterium]